MTSDPQKSQQAFGSQVFEHRVQEDASSIGAPILIKGATILSMAERPDDLERGDIIIHNGRIVEIGPCLTCKEAFVIDAAGMIAIPGFHDTHRHSWEGQLRRVIPSGDINDYTCTTHGGFAEHYAPQDIYAGTLLTVLHALSCGITSILDYSHNSQSLAHCHAAIDALADSGIRAVYACGAPSILGRARTNCEWPGVIAELAETRFADKNGLLTIRVAGTPATLGREFFELADQLNLGVSIDAVAGPSSSQWILDAGGKGWLGPDRTLIHCTALGDDAWGVIARTGTTVSLCPHADMQYAIGEPPLLQAMSAGVRPSISVDDDVGLSSDMWTQLRILSASFRHRFGMFADNVDYAKARALTAYDLLDYATAQGARANGLAERCGRLVVGLEADIVLINGEDLNNMPLNNAYGAVVLGSDTTSVSTVIVRGVIRKHEGKLVGVNEQALKKLVRSSRDRLFEKFDKTIDVLSRNA